MPIVRRTDCIKPRVVLAWMCWPRLCGVGTRVERTAWMQVFTCIHVVRSARVPTPHNRSQHIQANTTRGFIQSVLLTMGIMMPETCWVNLKWINTFTCVIRWFFLLLCKQSYVAVTFTTPPLFCRKRITHETLILHDKSEDGSVLRITNDLSTRIYLSYLGYSSRWSCYSFTYHRVPVF